MREPEIVKERKGHADIAETMRYSHVVVDIQRHTADRLDSVLAAATQAHSKRTGR